MQKAQSIKWNRFMALLVVLCLMLSAVDAGMFVSYASAQDKTYQIGDAVTATLSDSGVLSIQGAGETYDYQNRDEGRAPFYDDRHLVTQIEIADGVTSIGDYLFYNCENARGTLTLPASVVRIGERAFSGDSVQTAPAFVYVYNQFVAADLGTDGGAVQEPSVQPDPTPAPTPGGADEEAPSMEPAVTVPEVAPEAEPSVEPSAEPTVEPIAEPSVEPNAEPIAEPIVEPPADPTPATPEPGTEPSADPGAEPSPAPESGEAGPDGGETGAGEPVPTETAQDGVNRITQQELGDEIFFPGQMGVFECAQRQNQSFAMAAAGAGYAEVLSWTTAPFADGFENSAQYAVPVTEKGAFLPAYAETGLAVPADAQGPFAGWETGEAEVLSAHSFCALPEGVLTALWQDPNLLPLAAVPSEITFDLAKGPVSLGADYSGFDSAGNPVKGEHKAENYYIIAQSNAETATENGISFAGDNLTFRVELSGVNIHKAFVAGDDTDEAIQKNSSIFIPAYAGAVKHVTLYLRGDNILDNIAYYTNSLDDVTGAGVSASTLKITSASGDGALAGTLTADTTSRVRYTCIGGTGTKSPATGLTLAGGTITATGDSYEATIGGGSNGYADIKITGGRITATQRSGNAPAIGSGGGGTAEGAYAKVEITGGMVIAANQGAEGPAIGGGGSTDKSAGKAEIIIRGGTVVATAGGLYAISGGYSEAEKSYAASTVQITGGSVAGTIAGVPTADGTTEVKQTVVTLKSSGAPQANLAVDSLTLSSGAAYGTADMKTDGEGKIALWLPVGATVTTAQAGMYTFIGAVESGGNGELSSGSVVTFDLAKGPVVLGPTYSGKDSGGADVTGTHDDNLYYIVKQSNPETATTNTITFAGNGLTFQVLLDGLNVDRAFNNSGNDSNRATDSSLYIPAYLGEEKHVTLYLKGENKLNTICYYTIDGDSIGNGDGRSQSTLKITSAAGDGKLDGALTIDATQKGRFSCIGATGDKSTATGLTIAGGTITAANSGAEACIGGGSNGFAEVFITGGHITATQNGNAPAIGSGSGTAAVGADGEVTITGGTIVAKNISTQGVAIGAGGSARQVGGHATVKISGGKITADVTGGTAIGGGNSVDVAGGGATVEISGGTVTANGAIGGGFSTSVGYADAAITITGGSLNAMMSKTPTNGASNVYLTSATLYNADQRVTDTAVSALSVSGYGMKDVQTDGNGTLYLWLPENTELTSAQAEGAAFTGSILAKNAGILKYNSAKVYYSVHFPYDDRFAVYADAALQTPISGTQIVPAGDVLSFWVQAKAYSGSQSYAVDAYRSSGTAMTPLGAESVGSGRYAYNLTVTSNTELLFVTRAGSGARPRLSLDISTANATIGSDSVTIGGYTLPDYTGDFLFTSGGLPTAHMLIVKAGNHAVMIDRLVAQRSGNVIQVDGGRLSADASSFNNNLASTGYSAILVQKGAAFDLTVDGTDSLEIRSSGTAHAPIGGSGEINIVQKGGFLTLSGGGGEQITAQSYSYTTTALNGALPYSVKLTEGELVGYHDGSTLSAVNAVHTVNAATTFTACAVSYVLPDNAATPAHTITADGGLAVTLNAGTTVQSVKRGTAPLDSGSYTVASDVLTIVPGAAYGSLEITLGASGVISYKAADYSAEYTGEAHTFTVAVAYPADAAVEYSTDNISWSGTPPTRTDAGSQQVYWRINATGCEEVHGENQFTVTKGTNHWIADLVCPSVQYGSAPRPNAQAQWGEVTYRYYAAADLVNPLSGIPTDAGSYYVKALVAGTENYDELESDFVPFTIETTVIYSISGKVLDRLSTSDGVPISTAVSAPANGAFTISYGFFYIPNSSTTPLTLLFSKALPAGTKLTMLDICPGHADAPRFFYYTVPAGGATQVKSTDFVQMGTTTPGTFENADSATAREVQYQLCAELPAGAATGDFTIRLLQADKEIDKTMVTVTLTAPASPGALSLSATAGERTLSATAAVSGTAGSGNVLAVSLLDGNGNAVSFPAGAALALGGRAPLVVRGNFAAFDGIPNGTHAISITGLPAGEYQLRADLCAAPEKSAYPLAQSVCAATVPNLAVTAPEYAVHAELTGDQSRVVDGATGASLAFSVTYTGSGSLAVTCQSKRDGRYSALASQWTVTGAGALGGSPANVTVAVPAGTAPGTYRILFALGDAQFPYNIIVE